jgi:hypothetical protein
MGSNSNSGDAMFNGSTIIARSGSGIRVEASGGSSSANLYLDNSVLAGPGGNIEVIATNSGDSASFGSDSGAYDNTKLSSSGAGSKFVDPVDVVDLSAVSPGFVDAPNGNYRLAAGSALIDAGQSIDPPLGALDFEGNPRACHGTSSGVIRRDIGAFEFKADPNDDCTYPTASIGSNSEPSDPTPTFMFNSSKPNSSFTCAVDGEPFGPCATPHTTSVLSPGSHYIEVKVEDAYGNINPFAVSMDFEIDASCANDPTLCPDPPDPTCETDPSLCPKPDKTAPKVIGVKVAKKTKAKRVKVRFRSNEAGSKFKCKLNGAKWRACKSPWKTPKLKKGKNTIRIQATDKAGNRSRVVKRVIRRK